MGDTQPGRLHAIILAAGANTRLSGVIPPYTKPLLVVNGRTLIRGAYDHAVEAWGAESVTVVASPDNVRSLTHVITDARVHWVVQPTAVGILDAIARGLDPESAQTLILCGDNTFEPNTGLSVYRNRDEAIIAMRMLPGHQAKRFTRIKLHHHPDNDTAPSRLEIIQRSELEWGDGCWIGPLLLNTQPLREALANPQVSTIEALIMRATKDGWELAALPMQCEDLGVPEELR